MSSWDQLTGSDPVHWLLDSEEPAARWVALTALLDRDAGDPAVQGAHRDVVADPATMELVARLPDWTSGDRLSGHNSPSFAPNLLNVLADMGVGAGDFDEIERLLEPCSPTRRKADGSLRTPRFVEPRNRCGVRCCATATR